MAPKCSLQVDGTNYKLRTCSYELQQNVDENGRPSSQVMSSTIDLEIKSSDDTNIIDWMMDETGKKSRKIEFSKTDEEDILKTVEFEDVFLTSFKEHMDAISNTPKTESLKLSAKKIILNGVSHENVGKVNYNLLFPWGILYRIPTFYNSQSF